MYPFLIFDQPIIQQFNFHIIVFFILQIKLFNNIFTDIVIINNNLETAKIISFYIKKKLKTNVSFSIACDQPIISTI